MPNPDVACNRADPSEDSGWRRFTASLPMRTALLAVAAVWMLGAVWSFTEQSAFAGNKGFSYPHLLPLVIDGFAVAMAGVAWAASLDARPAVAARLATVIAVAASSASNGAWAYLRTNHDLTAVVLGVAVPVAANLAFEVLLAEMRRQVQRRRGLPPPVAIPYPRLIRLGLAPFRTFVEWRELVLDLTQMDLAVARGPEPTAPPAHEVHPVSSRPERPNTVPSVREPISHDSAQPALPAQANALPQSEEPAEVPRRLIQPPPARTAARSEHPGSRSVAGRSAASGRASQGQSAPPAAQNGHPVVRRRDLEAVPATAPARLSAAGPPARTNNARRTIDPRVELLAAHLASTEDAGEFTGEMVGPLLDIDVAPRTGRRLLGLARELVNERSQTDTDPRDDELSAAIGGG